LRPAPSAPIQKNGHEKPYEESGEEEYPLPSELVAHNEDCEQCCDQDTVDEQPAQSARHVSIIAERFADC
jgi:hypothetical protein